MRRCRPRLPGAAWLAVALALAATAPVSGCATAGSGSVDTPLPWIREELYLGGSIPGGGEISHADWERFVEEEVATRFPDGFTILEGEGRWRQANGAAVRERTRVLVILRRTDDRRAAAAIGELARAYVERFGQEAVLRVSDPVDARF